MAETRLVADKFEENRGHLRAVAIACSVPHEAMTGARGLAAP